MTVGLFKGATTVWVIVQSPKAFDRESAVKAMMASVRLGRPASREEQINALPFSAKPAPPFRLARAYSGLSLGLTVGDKDVDPKGEQPWILISYETQPMSSQAALDGFAEKHHLLAIGNAVELPNDLSPHTNGRIPHDRHRRTDQVPSTPSPVSKPQPRACTTTTANVSGT